MFDAPDPIEAIGSVSLRHYQAIRYNWVSQAGRLSLSIEVKPWPFCVFERSKLLKASN